jgi:hypothetical protein
MANEFKLQLAVDNFIDNLSSKRTTTQADLKELQSHLHDTTQTLTQQGLSEREAFEVAKLRLGTTEELSTEYEKVNGINMLNKEWVFIFIGICISILVWNILETLQCIVAYWTNSGHLTIISAACILSFVYLSVACSSIALFIKGRSITIFIKQHLLDRNVFVIGLLAGLAGVFCILPMSRFLGYNIYSKPGHLITDIVYENPLTEFIIRVTIPITIILSIFLSTQSVNKKLSWHTLFQSKSYLYLFLLGFGWEALAAMTGRMLLRGDWLGPIIFGLVYCIGIIALTKYNRNISLLKIFIFSSTAIYFEALWGYFNKDLSVGAAKLTSPFAWALAIAIVVGVFIGKKLSIAEK